MTAFEDAFRKAGRSDLVNQKEAADRQRVEHELEQIRLLLRKLCKIRSDAMTAYDIARQHRNHFVKTTKEGSKEYFVGVSNPYNQDIWRTGLKAKMQLNETNNHISKLEQKRDELKDKLKVQSK